MKKVVTLFALLLLTVMAWAQNPKLTYQAVVRDNANMLVTNSTVDVTLSVLRTDNSLQYTQSFDNVPTNQNGLFSLFFGGETGWDNVNWIHSKIAVAITLPDLSVVKDTTEVNAVPLAISTINSGTSGPSTQVQSDWAQTDQTDPSFIQNKPEIGDSVNTILVNGQYVTVTMLDGRHYLTSDSVVIVNMQNNISNNTTNIAANTTNIATNTANISNNTTNIAANTTNIATNTANISNNTTNIAANTTNISNNTANIETNTTNIAANTTNISNNTANIETNTTNIATNTTNINNNTANIASNTTNINNLILHTKKAAIRDSVAGQIHDSIAAIGATITQNHTHTNMSVLSATTAPFTTANKATLDSLAAAGAEQNVQANWNETNAANDAFIRNKPSITDTVNTILANRNFVTNTIMDGRHYLTSDSVVIVNMQNNISNNIANIATNTTNINNNTANIASNTTNINNNTTNIAANTTNIATNTTNISNNTANIATNTTNISNNTTNISNNTANIATNTTNISNNTANIATNTTNISNNTANIATNTTNINNNTTNIASNTTNINNLILHTKKAAIRDSVAGQIHDSIAAIGATITQNHTHTNMSVLSATTAPFTTANKTTLDSLAAAGAEQNVQANWNETNAANDAFIRNKPSITDTVNTILANRNYVTNTVMDGRHYLTSDSVVIVNMRNNISNNTTNIISNTTNIEANTTNINNNTTKIETNITNIATNTTNISNNTTNIANNTANIATNTTNISNNTTNIATNRTNIATNTTNINNNTANIATNTTNINKLILHTKKAAIRDSVAGQIHDSIAANNLVTINNNQTISGDKTFTGTTIVPSGFTLGTTTASNCNNVAVNACDLLAVFDSIQRRMDNLESVIEDLHDEVANLRDTVRILRGDSVPTVTVTIPTVTTSSATNITETSATCGGNVTADGGADVTARGVCWGTGANPTIDGSHTTVGTGTGSFSSTITGLTANTTYHVRAYATNSEGTAYGEEVSFTTQNTTPVTPVDGQPCPGAPTVTDHQGNIYNTVQIGEQCWTRENMRCTTSPSTGTTILEATPTSYSYTGKKAYYVDGSSSNTSTYGLLYNWNAAVDTFNTAYGETSTNTSSSNAVNVTFSGHRRGICPTGWHVPSDAEWTQLTTYVSSQSEYVCGSNNDNIAKALASTTGWNSYSSTCAVGNNPSANNATGFAAVPAGDYFDGDYDNFGHNAYLWSATQNFSYDAYHRNLYRGSVGVNRNSPGKAVGYIVRCLRDEVSGPTASLPTVTTSPVTDITETSATCGGNVTADGGASVTARGVCWSTDANPTIDGSHTTDGTGTGSFTSTITGLTANTTYHVRTYATNSEGTAYGEEVSFTSKKSSYSDCGPLPCPAPATSMIVDTVYQFDSILYNGLHFEYDSDGHIIGASEYKGTELAIKCGWIYKFNVVAGGIYEWNTDVSHGRVATIGDVLRTRITLFYDDFQTYATASQSAVNTEVDGCEAAGLAWKANYTGTVGVMVTRGDQGIGSDDDFCACNEDSLYLRFDKLKEPTSSFFVWGRYGSSDTLPCDNGIHYIYDSGLNSMQSYATGDYSNNENGYLVLYPGDVRSKLKLWGACKMQVGDTLFIYNGDISSNPSILPFSTITGQDDALGSEANPIFISQIAGQPISLRMQSDSSCTLAGLTLKAKCCPVAVSLPTVTTSSVTNITETTATCGGNVTADGGADVTARGVCWSTDANPTIDGSHTTDGTSTGSFTSTITGLTAGTTYHVRAYATNSEGTAYGEEVSFTTQNTTPVTPVDGQPCPGAATVTDHQGNVYNTVQIGSQCWTKENMRCTTSPTTRTTILEESPTSYSYTGKKAYYVDGNSSNTSAYGLLYNWNAAVDTFNTAYGETSTNTDYNKAVSVTFSGHRRGICPEGWHVPSDAEWTQLTDYVGSQSEYVCDSFNSQKFIAKALASTTGWYIYKGTSSNCYPSYDTSSNNATGFSAVPANPYSGTYNVTFFVTLTCFWSASQGDSEAAYLRQLRASSVYLDRAFSFETYSKYNGYSVRCLRDEAGGSAASLPTVTTSSATNITETTATCGGNVTADGGADVTARGVCWGTDANPTIDGIHTTDGTGTGSFSSTITGLTAGTTYHVRAYATNSAGTAYGEDVSFTTQNTTPVTPADGQPCPGAATVTDHQGNVYNTVQIGSQCWTKENMRCTTSPTTGTTILEASPTSYSYTGKKAYYVDGNSSRTSTYGLLYNWNAAVDTFNTAFDETSTNTSSSNAVSVTFSGKRRGICPQGWHVPSDAEWTQLTTYVKSQQEYVCSGCSGTDDGNFTYCIAKALASATGWNSYTGTASGRDCYPGYAPSSNNAAGFSALPAGNYGGSSLYNVGYYAYFWSSTPVGSLLAYGRHFGYDSEYVFRGLCGRDGGFSVRCLRD